MSKRPGKFPALQTIGLLSACALGIGIGINFSGTTPDASEGEGTSTESALNDSSTSGPQLEFENAEADFGKIFSSKTIDQVFRFKNVGTEAIRIEAVDVCCGVTLAKPYQTEVDPGDSGEIAIRVRANLYQTAPFRKTITVRSNDADDPLIPLVVTGQITREFDVKPSGAVFNVSDATKDPQNQVLQLINNLEEDIHVTSVRCADPQFSVQLTTHEDGRRYDVTVRVAPPFEAGVTHSIIEIRTDHPDHGLITVPTYLHRESVISTIPKRVVMPVPLPAGYRREIIVRHATGAAFNVNELSVSGDLTVKLLPESSSKGLIRLLLTGPEGYLVPKQGDQIMMQTDDPISSSITLAIIRDPLADPATTPTSRINSD